LIFLGCRSYSWYEHSTFVERHDGLVGLAHRPNMKGVRQKGANPLARSNHVPPRKLKGFRDFLPEQAQRRKQIIDTIWQQATQAGFQPIETPVLEYAETLLGAGGQETDKEVYRFEDHGGRDVGLRFDLTVPFARFVAENQGTLVLPFKKVQIANSWRGEKPQKGRYREFCQADIDIIGVDSAAADIEVLATLYSFLNQLVTQPFTMSIGHRKILSAILQQAFPDLSPDGEAKALIALDKTDKVGAAKVRELLLAIDGCHEQGVERLQMMLNRKTADGDGDLAALAEDLAAVPEVQPEIARFQKVITVLQKLTIHGHGRVKVDLNIARGLGYYTGIVFETTINALPGFGSISSGGRYNDLVSRFSRQGLPGIGGSIGVDRLLAAFEELEAANKPPQAARTGCFIAVATEDALGAAFELATAMRQIHGLRGIAVDVGLKIGKLGQQFKYADRRRFACVVTVGDDELAKQLYPIKDLETGREQHWSREQLLTPAATDGGDQETHESLIR
jgi:histidyl-tRNA synthetase